MMKFAVAFVALVAVAVASPNTKPLDASVAELQAIMAAIASPSTDPATAVLLEQQLNDILASVVAPVEYDPIFIEPIVEHDGGAVTAEEPVAVSPVVAPTPVVDASAAPLVQIILNINQADSAAAPVAPVAPGAVVAPVEAQQPVQVVDQAVVLEPNMPEPVQVGTPVMPLPVITIPGILN